MNLILPRITHNDDFFLLNLVRAYVSVGKEAQTASDDESVEKTQYHGPRHKTGVPWFQVRIVSGVQQGDSEKQENDGVASSCHGFGEILYSIVRFLGDVVANILPLKHSTRHHTQDT